MEMQIEMIFAKLEFDDLAMLGTGLDEAKKVGRSGCTTVGFGARFTASAENRFAVADKLFAMGPAVIPELESRIENEEDPESTTPAAYSQLLMTTPPPVTAPDPRGKPLLAVSARPASALPSTISNLSTAATSPDKLAPPRSSNAI